MRAKQITIFAILFVVLLFLILLNVRGNLSPVQSAATQAPRPFVYIFSGVGNSIKSFFTYFGSVRKLNKENAQLSETVRQLQLEKVQLEQYKVENDLLKKEISFRTSAKFDLISAAVIGSDPTGFSQIVIISAGTSDGIKTGSAVLAQGVFIGKIISADSFTSKVLLITDPQSTVQAQIAGTTDNGVVRGSYGSGILLDMISQNVQINKGDEVITSGLSAELPRGILIGVVGEVQSQKNDLLQKATVISGADLKNLSLVSVIK